MSDRPLHLQDFVNFLYSGDYKETAATLDIHSKKRLIIALKDHCDNFHPKDPSDIYATIVNKVDSLEDLFEITAIYFIPNATDLILKYNQHLPEQDRLFIKMGGLDR